MKVLKRFVMKMSGSGEVHSAWVYVKEVFGSEPTDVSLDGLALIRSFPMPSTPTGSTEFYSPVPHQSSYQDAIDIYVESYQGGRNDYFKWVSEQQGLHRMSRTKRHIKRPNDKVPSES